MGLWNTACDLLAQTRGTAQIHGSRILIAPPTSAYTQYKYITSARVGSHVVLLLPYIHVCMGVCNFV